ncbi:MAG: diguanylate cyclase [Bryobacteraceae bacterium]|jgi:diguanylate cyclase (GGDEF)-like protein
MPTQAHRKKSWIVVLAPDEPVEYFGLLWDGVKSAAAEISSLGARVESVVTPCYDVVRQKEILADLLSSAPDAIAMVPAHASALDNLIDRHTAQRTRVITFNADAPLSRRASYVGPDAIKSGALAAEVLTKLMGDGAGVVSFPGPLETGNLAARYGGFLTELTRWRPDARILACYEGTENLRETAIALLRENPGVGGIYVGNARAYQIGAALESAGMHVPCVGFDNTEAVRRFLRNRLVSAVIDQNVYQQGYLAVQRAWEAVSSRVRVARATIIPGTVVFATNAHDSANTDTLNEAFEQLVRKRTARLRASRRMLEEANRQLLELAETDSLTGLLNRRKIEQLFNQLLAQCSPASPFSLLMVDVNQFKNVNDTHGHPAGDEALKAVARVLTAQAPAAAACGRVGGDEFCVLLPGTDDLTAANLRERLHHAISEVTVFSHSGNFRMRVSIGCATAPQKGTTPHDLLLAADQDLYAEKHRDAAHQPGTAKPISRLM